MEKRDVVYCDAAFFGSASHHKKHPKDRSSCRVILGILHRKELTRIRAYARNNVVAELLAILMARKLYPGKIIINDCKAVIDILNENREQSLRKLLGADAQVEFLLQDKDVRGVLWQRRRTDEESNVVDSITRKFIGRRFAHYLTKNGYTMKEFGF